MATSIDEQFVEFIIKSLVGKPDEVKIERTIDEKGVLLELTVDPEDLGRVIGKRGATAQSVRTLLRALGTKNEARYNLKIVDNGVQGPKRRRDDDDQANTSAKTDEPAENTSSSDDSAADEPVEEAAVETTVAEEPETEVERPEEEESLADKTRKELDDLDDLDI